MKIILTEKQLEKLVKNSGWKQVNGKLTKIYRFENYDEVIEFVNDVAKIAKKQNHHPDMVVKYDCVKLTMFDHEANDITEKCFKFTNAVDMMISKKKQIHEDEKTPAKKEKTERFIKCKNCKKLFTQTIRKDKKSLPICPHCGTHNNEKR